MNDKITYSDFIEQVAAKGDVSQTLIHDLLAATIHLVEDSLNETGEAVIHGLGKFNLVWHNEREGRNPQTGETIQIPAHSSVRFKPDSHLRQFINRRYAYLKPQFLKEPRRSLNQHKDVVETSYEMPASFDKASFSETSSRNERKSSWRLWWLIVPLIVILLAFLFWPKSDDVKPVSDQPVIAEKSEMAAEEQAVNTEEEAQRLAALTQHSIHAGRHTVKSGDNLWLLADMHFGLSYLWPHIYSANSNEIGNPDRLIPGKAILLPALEGQPDQLTKNDKKQIAEGFLQAYLFYKDKDSARARGYLWVVQTWGLDDVIAQYKNQIDANDLALAKQMKGEVQI